jgi:hypothetical protein
MTDELRRKSDDLILEMAGDIKVILSKLNDHSNWIKDHQIADDKNFTKINDDILIARTTIHNSKMYRNACVWLCCDTGDNDCKRFD